MASAAVLRPLRPRPFASPRPWAGTRLEAAGAGAGIGELWLAGPDLDAGDGSGRTLDAMAEEHRGALVGTHGLARYGARFPLIVKLIDAADWLSLQVHPDDLLARELYGPDAVGKAEAWLVLEAGPGAELVVGPAAALDPDALPAAVAAGEAGMAHCRRIPATPGDALLIRPGTLHAIGAGTFVYELEQPSDLTFRISDWGRPTGRTLHVAEALRALRPERSAEPAGSGFRLEGGALTAPEFRLELPDLDAGPAERRPAGQTCEVVTAIRGTLRLEGDGWTETLPPLDTLVVPAAVARYEIRGAAGAIACIGSVP
jgi:mannose-6-phosphate isomerase